jgi:hypothetical protein
MGVAEVRVFVWFHLGTRCRRVVSFSLRRRYSQGNSLWYPLDRMMVGPKSRSGRCGVQKNLSLTVIEPRPSSSGPVAIPTANPARLMTQFLVETLRCRQPNWVWKGAARLRECATCDLIYTDGGLSRSACNFRTSNVFRLLSLTVCQLRIYVSA